MRKFRTKSKNNNYIIYLGLFIISVSLSINYLIRENLITNDTFLDYLLTDTLKVSKSSSDVDFLFKYALNTELDKSNLVLKELENDLIKEDVTDNYELPKDILPSEPIVYIYNTHQSEKYKSNYLESYNIASTVLLASKILKEYLEDLGIKVIVEEQDITKLIHSLNYSYGKSYTVSRMLLEEAKKKHDSLTYFIDLHRDSSVYEKTTAVIDGENYAKLLFVVGLDHDNYEPNLALVEDLSAIIKKYNENLYRGIMKKSGKGVNGIYNQDFSPKAFLVEVGGQYNTIEEVNNTLKIFSQVLYEYIVEDLDEKEKE